VGAPNAILSVRNVYKYFGGVVALDNVTIDFTAGETTAIIGPNGSGKTTLINVITQWVKPDAGEIYHGSTRLNNMRIIDVVKLGIGRSFQIPRIFKELTVMENLLVGAISRLNKNYNLFGSETACVRKVNEVASLFGFENKLDLPASQLSQGERKLLDVAMCFTLDPKILLLDEPTSGVDTKRKREVIETIIKVGHETGKTIIMIEHDIELAVEYSDSIIFLKDGKVIQNARKDEKEKVLKLIG